MQGLLRLLGVTWATASAASLYVHRLATPLPLETLSLHFPKFPSKHLAYVLMLCSCHRLVTEDLSQKRMLILYPIFLLYIYFVSLQTGA